MGFTVDVDQSATGSQWLCLATIPIYPHFAELNEFRRIFTALASKYNGEYDGWETEVL